MRRRDLYLTTHNTHNRQTSMPPVGFEPTISAGERPKTYVLDRAVTGTGGTVLLFYVINQQRHTNKRVYHTIYYYRTHIVGVLMLVYFRV